MKKALIVIVALATAIIGATAHTADAGWLSRNRAKALKVHADGSFTFKGTFNGRLVDRVEIHGESIVLNDKTSIYVQGKRMARGAYVIGADVYAGGVMHDGIAVASFIVVRQPQKGTKKPVREDSKIWVRSNVNQNVGHYDYGAGYEE